MFNRILAVYKKELKDYFHSSIAYVFLILFILIPNLMFFYIFGGIFREETATMRIFFTMLPYTLILFIPGLTMGAWAKEKNAGTIELLFTLPVTQLEVMIGKFTAAMTLVLIALAATLPIPLLTHLFLGDFDWGQIFCQYLGAILIAGCYISITFFLSSLTGELIDAFLLSASLLFILTLIGYFSMTIKFYDWLAWLQIIFNKISLSSHFMNFSKGVIDTRDVIYYLGVTAIFFYLNIHSLESKKWS